MPTAGGGRVHALYVCSGGGVNRHASIVPSALLLQIGWRRERERFRCDTTGTAACPMMGWQRDDVVRVPWMWGGGWCVVRCLLDMRRAGDEMMRCSCPRAFSLSFSFRPAPSPRLFPICLLDLIPRPPGRGRRGLMSICGCGRRADLLARYRSRAAHSAHRSFAFSRRSAVACFASCGVPSSPLLPCRFVFDTG